LPSFSSSAACFGAPFRTYKDRFPFRERIDLHPIDFASGGPATYRLDCRNR
jgi:hypothetical protein